MQISIKYVDLKLVSLLNEVENHHIEQAISRYTSTNLPLPLIY